MGVMRSWDLRDLLFECIADNTGLWENITIAISDYNRVSGIIGVFFFSINISMENLLTVWNAYIAAKIVCWRHNSDFLKVTRCVTPRNG